MKKTLTLLALLAPSAAHGQQHIVDALAELERFDEANALALEATDDTWHALWTAGLDILSGEIENVPNATFAMVEEAFVGLVASPDRGVYRLTTNILRDAGLAGYDGAADALHRGYEARLEAGVTDGLGTISRHLAEQPNGRGLPYLVQIATRNNDDFGEAEMHDGVLEGSHTALLSVTASNNYAMMVMGQSPEGRDALLELDAAGSLNRLGQRLIRYDEGGYGEEICGAVPELAVCVERSILRFDRGHETIDPCIGSGDIGACHEQYWGEIEACADEAEGDIRFFYRTARSFECRDEVMIRWILAMEP